MDCSNVIPFRRGNQSYCFLVGDESFQDNEIITLMNGYPLLPVHSEEDLRRALIFFRPSLILVRSNLSWGEPIDLISEISRVSQAPIILVLEKLSQRKEEVLIKKAYQAGIFDVLRSPLKREEVIETLNLPMRISGCYPIAF